MTRYLTPLLGLLAAAAPGRADEPLPTPLTRPEMKKALESIKARKPRIPLPELTPEEAAKLDERSRSYESRLRSVYMPGQGDGRSAFGFGGSREPDPEMTLDYAFKVKLFWLVSRTNNCLY